MAAVTVTTAPPLTTFFYNGPYGPANINATSQAEAMSIYNQHYAPKKGGWSAWVWIIVIIIVIIIIGLIIWAIVAATNNNNGGGRQIGDNCLSSNDCRSDAYCAADGRCRVGRGRIAGDSCNANVDCTIGHDCRDDNNNGKTCQLIRRLN